MKKNQTSSDYILGGRKLGKFVSAMSAEASDMSGWLLLGLPGVAYLTGLSSAGWTAIGLAIGTYLNWKFIAKRLRIYTHKAKDSITIPEFFKNRFGDKKAYTSTIASIFIVIFFIVIILFFLCIRVICSKETMWRATNSLYAGFCRRHLPDMRSIPE